MKYFVLIYDRSRQQLLDLREFPESEAAAASDFRFQAQRRAFQEKLDQDIVLFQAVSREALMRTHGSYFFTSQELLDRARQALEAS